MADNPVRRTRDRHADTFLVYTPDAVMRRVLRPLCGFNWGFRLHEGKVLLDPVFVADAGDWEKNLPDLRELLWLDLRRGR